MAYLPQSQAERERLQQEQEGAQGPQLGGQSGVITGGAPQAGQQPQGSGQGTRSGSFTNLNAYLNANKEQATGLGQRVASNVAGQADQAKAGLQQAQGTFKAQADQGSVARNSELVREAVSNPVTFVGDQNKRQQFAQMRDAQYKGPQGLQDVSGYGETAQKVQDANTALDNTKSEPGRFSLVQQQFAKPTYARGQQRLDQLLLQNSPGARQEFANVQQRYSGLMGELDSTKAQAQSYAQQRAQETAAARQEAQSAIGGAMNQFQSQLDQKVATQRAQEQAAADRLRAALNASGDLELDDDTMQRLGLQDGQRLYDTDFSRFQVQFNPDDINAQRVADANDYQRYSALSQLAGVDPTLLADPSLAGTAGRAQVDTSTIAQARQQAEDRFNALKRDQVVGAYVMPSDAELAGRNIADVWDSASVDDVANWARQAPMNVGDLGTGDTYAYQQIQNWLRQYEAMKPSRKVKRKG